MRYVQQLASQSQRENLTLDGSGDTIVWEQRRGGGRNIQRKLALEYEVEVSGRSKTLLRERMLAVGK